MDSNVSSFHANGSEEDNPSSRHRHTQFSPGDHLHNRLMPQIIRLCHSAKKEVIHVLEVKDGRGSLRALCFDRPHATQLQKFSCNTAPSPQRPKFLSARSSQLQKFRRTREEGASDSSREVEASTR
ncbi:hypothetical protein KSP40_PGU012615 [Platanthera guangdongensis]|uniref:Uncharacterized protein n=1 Tax=Platanthera guangdongensis TaxID=2320717 RepID=A0ABR2LRG8_9ASPA